MFSRRTATPRAPNRLAQALMRAQGAARDILDLTVSNPTVAGIPYDETRILAALGDRRALEYHPSPFGLLEARREVSRLYADEGIDVDPARVVLTASTSEAYAFLFKLLCDDGDDVLVPEPSYPLFDLLARFEGVTLRPYALSYDGRWHLDPSSIARAVGPRSRAILLVSPNNPTGSYVTETEHAMLAETELPLISDEVFAPFVLQARLERRPSVLASAAPLAFALSGLSKLAGLPQMKLAWIVAGGSDHAMVAEALERIELLGDAFLSVSTPIQLALPAILSQRHATVDAIMARLHRNLEELRANVEGTAITALDVEGGWYATLRLPGTETEERWTLLFLEEDGVYVHPGHLFDFASEAYVVVSLLTPEAAFSRGIARIVARVRAQGS